MPLSAVKIPKIRVWLFLLFLLLLSVLAGCLDSARHRDPQVCWRNNQGVVYMDQHNYARAQQEFSQVIALDPDYAIGYANLGIAYYSLGKYDSAAVALQKALSLDPQLLQAHYTLGLIYYAQGKEYEKALQALETVARSDPDDPHLLYYLGQVRSKLGQNEQAIEDLRQAIRLDPYNVSAYYALANHYRRLDRQAEWRTTLQEFNRLTQAGHQGVSSSYQGQGMYAEAIIDTSGADLKQDDAQVRPRFSGPLSLPALPAAVRFAALAHGDRDLLVLAGDGLHLYRQDRLSLVPVPEARFSLPAGAEPAHLTVFDLDNDGDADLALSGGQLLLLIASSTEAWTESRSLAVAANRTFPGDVDHDGDLDLLVATADHTQLWTNDGQGRFANHTGEAGLTEAFPALQAIFSDFDNDRDIDFFLLGEKGLQVWSNNRDGTFSERASTLGFETGIDGLSLSVEDFDQDSFMDLALLSADGKVYLWRNQGGRRFAFQTSIATSLERARGLQAIDLDDDGDLDLVAFGRGGIRLLICRGTHFERDDQVWLPEADLSQVFAFDPNADGLADLWADGVLLPNQTPGGHWLKVVAQGLASNRDGIGTKVEVKTTNRLQKREVRRAGPLLFGLSRADTVEFVRLLWPGGVRQTELATGAGQTLTIAELDRKGTSCPIVYAWDGERFRFVSDINGGAIIGYLLAPGEYFIPDPDEYLRLGPIAAKEGRYLIQLANQLEEIIYVDALHLLAVDHPLGVDLYPNERLLSGPPYPEFDLYPLTALRPPVRASDHRGQEILAKLTAADDNWYDGFELTDIHGYAKDYSLTLDLGDLSHYHHPVLVAYGWVDYAHSTSNWAATQRGLHLYPPRVEVPDGRGSWIEVCADMGTPAGLPKSMIFDLKGIFPSHDYRLRLSTNTAIYWDQFLVGERVDVPLHLYRLQPLFGDLHWRGYPEHEAIKGTFAFRYYYDRLHLEAPWGTHAGAFTRYGPVEKVVSEVDDQYAIMFHGDELTVQFDATALPPLKPGMARTFLLYSNGFGKDMDFHSAHSLTVEPLPFHGMSRYPYPAAESYPLDQAHLDYLLEYNTRQVKGYYQ